MEEPIYNIRGIEGDVPELLRASDLLGISEERVDELWKITGDVIDSQIRRSEEDEFDSARGYVALNPAQIAVRASRFAKEPSELLMLGIMAVQGAKILYDRPEQAMVRMLKKLGGLGDLGFDINSIGDE